MQSGQQARVCALFLAASGCGLSYETHSDLVYDATLPQAYGRMDVYVPQGAADLRAGVVLVHPGGWSSGSKADLGNLAERLARAGFVAATINYRLKSPFPEPIQDVWCALAYVRQHAQDFQLDPSRVALVGYSAGGYLVDMVALAPPNAPQSTLCPNGVTGPPVAVVAGDAPTDLNGIAEVSGFDDVPALVGSPCGPGSHCAADSPISNVRSGTPPFLLLQGTGDWLVSSDQTQSFAHLLEDAGNSVTLLLLRGDGHQLNPGPDLGSPDISNFTIQSPEGLSATLSFLQERLGVPPR